MTRIEDLLLADSLSMASTRGCVQLSPYSLPPHIQSI